MKVPVLHRKGIPLFYNKTELDYQKDPYERYSDMVAKQTALHLVDEVWGNYPLQAVFDFAKPHYPEQGQVNILELGCSVGRWIGTLAQQYPEAQCWGIDYSYQMLKRAQEFWMQGEEIQLNLANKGHLPTVKIKGHQLKNLQFGLAKAADLPFLDNSQDLLLNSFLLDRLDNPTKGLVEMHRVLKPEGKLILITPLNFKQSRLWKDYYPAVKIVHLLQEIGFTILDWQEELLILEPLDIHGNAVHWNCLAFVASKD